MTFYAVDSKRQSMRSTGIVNEVKDWVVGADGKRRPGEAQSRDEDTGMPLWEVEVLYRQVSFGRESNTTGVVRVGSPVRPVMGEFAPVRFDALTAEVRVTKAGGLAESWQAEALSEDTGTGTTAGQSTVGGSVAGGSGAAGSKAAAS